VGPVLEADLVVVIGDLVDLEPFGPRVGEPLLLALEVVFRARMPSRKPGRVTRRAMVAGSWQSMQPMGCVKSFRASAYGIWL
jgi:hypothetical protein